MQILSTKLSVPSLRVRHVPRTQLIQRLNQGLECGFLLVSAPAGYGKSTLLAEWLQQLPVSTAWLLLDDKDNDLARFAMYLTAAFHQIDPTFDIIEVISQDHPLKQVETLLTPLVNHLAQLTKPICLVMDDYHVIQDQAVHQAVSFLLENRPKTLHLVIATRADPPFPLSRLRARSAMFELRMADLRFKTQEAADFLTHTMGLKISAEEVTLITRRTEGWIAGLEMAALSMQNLEDVSGFINTFTGNQHYIYDYLLGEILSHQSSEIQRFLLYTSILDQFCAPLCDTLMAGDKKSCSAPPSTIILQELEHSNLFIIPLDHEQQWYRYHPLFTELLRSHLQHKYQDQLQFLHMRASAWFESQGMISEAIRHSFAVNDWERIVRLVSANVFALLEQNELTSLSRQLENLSHEVSAARPWLLIGRAWLAAYTGQLDSVEPILKEIEFEIDSLKGEVELQTLGGHVAAIRAYTNWMNDKRDLAVNAAQIALEWLPADERLIRCQAATLLGLSNTHFTIRARALEQALKYASECKVSHVTIFAHGCWAWFLLIQGRFHEAHAACLEAIRLAQKDSPHQAIPTLSNVYTTLSSMLLEWNDLQKALFYAKEAVDLARRWGQVDALHFALDNLGYVLFESGDRDAAFEALHQAWQVATHTSTWFEQITISQQIDWYLKMGDLESALVQLQKIPLEISDPSQIPMKTFQSGLLPLEIVKIYLYQNECIKAQALITTILPVMEKQQLGYYVIRLLVWQALAYSESKQGSQAFGSIQRALTLAAPAGLVRTFTQECPRIVPLLRQARTAGIMPDYVDHLLTTYESSAKKGPAKPTVPSALIEPLSNREREVLNLLALGCSDKKIAETLVIARETVHKHLKNIYSKLDVHNRVEATVRARQLGLL
jgi:LuxR family maltose regulon positive regulatory protein